MADFMDMLQPQQGVVPQAAGPQAAPQQGAAPPVNPEEFNARTNGWMQAIDALRANPAAQQAIMFFGTRMLQGPKLGQSGGGVVGEALMGSTQMYEALNQNRETLDREEMDRQSQRDVRTQQVAESKQRTAESKEKLPLELQGLELNARAAKLKADLAVIDLKVAQGITTEERIKNQRDKMRLELANIEANIGQSKASAANSYAAATANQELAASRRDVRPWEASKAASEATEAMHKANIAGVDLSDRAKGIPISGKSGTVPAKLQEMQFMREQIRMQNPGISEQELSAKFIENQAMAKLNPQQADLKLIELWQAEQEMGTTTLTKEQYLEAGRALLSRKGAAPPGPKGVPGAGQPTRWTKDANGNPIRVKQ